MHAIFSSVEAKDDLTGKVSTEGRLNIDTMVNADCVVKDDVPMAALYYLLF